MSGFKLFTSSYIPTLEIKNKIESDNYIWHLYLTVTFDIHNWHLYLTVTFGIYIWHLSLTFISDISIWHLYLTFIFDVYIWPFYLTFMSGMWFHTFSTTVFKTVVKNVLNTYFTTVLKTVVKMVLDRQTLIFTVANFFLCLKQDTFSKSSNETRRIWSLLAAPVVANSGNKT